MGIWNPGFIQDFEHWGGTPKSGIDVEGMLPLWGLGPCPLPSENLYNIDALRWLLRSSESTYSHS